MLGKYKGFNVPRKDLNRVGGMPSDEEQTLENKFCYHARSIDCIRCIECLFCASSSGREDNNAAFNEWYAAKGKVGYDRD